MANSFTGLSFPLFELLVFGFVVFFVLRILVPVLRKPSPAKTASASQRAETQTFDRKALFNKSELRVFDVLKDELGMLAPGFNLLGQVSLAEVVKTASRFQKGSGYYAVSNRRLDFLVIDKNASPLLAIEYHGSGHYQGNAEKRDHIKKTILDKAGIALLIIHANADNDSVRAMLRTELAKLGIEMPSPDSPSNEHVA